MEQDASDLEPFKVATVQRTLVPDDCSIAELVMALAAETPDARGIDGFPSTIQLAATMLQTSSKGWSQEQVQHEPKEGPGVECAKIIVQAVLRARMARLLPPHPRLQP